MTAENKFIIELSRAAILNERPDVTSIDIDSIDWKYIQEKSRAQNISGLIGGAVLELPKEYGYDEAFWEHEVFQTIQFMSRKFAEFERVSQVMHHEDIRITALKGIITKDLYPVPELRTMGDFDILIDENNMEKSENAFRDMGYETDRIVDKEIKDGVTAEFFPGFSAVKDGIEWEVFFELKEEFRTNYSHYHNTVLENIVPYTENVYTLAPTYMAAHMLTHHAKHMMFLGAGIRNILDIALYIKKYDTSIDYDTVEKICKEQSYGDIYIYTLNAVKEYYGISASASCRNCRTDVFMDTLLEGGVFGAMNDNVMLQHVARIDVQNSGVLRILFPSAKMISHRFTYLRGHPWLLPVAWVHRVFYARKHHGYTIPKMLQGLGAAIKFKKKRMRNKNKLKDSLREQKGCE